MNAPEPTVFVVDDDAALCDALQALLEAEGLRVQSFSSAEAFLAAYRPDTPGCLLLDVRMRGMSGLELQSRLAQENLALPIIIMTGHGDIPMAVRAMKVGAVDFLEKPVNDQVLLRRIRMALLESQRRQQRQTAQDDVAARLATLTPREREVLDLVVGGRVNKQIAAELGVSEKTIEVHRKRLMQKLGVHSAVGLVRIVMETRPGL